MEIRSQNDIMMQKALFYIVLNQNMAQTEILLWTDGMMTTGI